MTSENPDNRQIDFISVRDFLSDGGSAYMLADQDPQDLIALYAYANQLFEAEDFKAARNLYMMLVHLDQWNSYYLSALGLTYQRLGQHEEALFMFAHAALIKIDDPAPSLYAGVSFQILGNTERAQMAFNTAIRCAGQRTECQAIRNTASSFLANAQGGTET